MSFGNSNNKQFLLNQLVWIGISFGISITISMLVPFPISLVAIFGVFIMLNVYMRRIMIKRMGGQGVGAMFGSTFGSSQNSSSLKYYCMNCGTQHRQIACPNCGSKMKRVGSQTLHKLLLQIKSSREPLPQMQQQTAQQNLTRQLQVVRRR